VCVCVRECVYACVCERVCVCVKEKQRERERERERERKRTRLHLLYILLPLFNFATGFCFSISMMIVFFKTSTEHWLYLKLVEAFHIVSDCKTAVYFERCLILALAQ